MGGRQRTSLFMGLEEKKTREERTGRERGKKGKKR